MPYVWVSRQRKDGEKTQHCVDDKGEPGHFEYTRALCGITGPFDDKPQPIDRICHKCDVKLIRLNALAKEEEEWLSI